MSIKHLATVNEERWFHKEPEATPDAASSGTFFWVF